MTWTFQLANRAGQALGELRNARSRSLRFPLNRVPTLSFSIDVAHPLAPRFLTVDQVLVKAYDDSTGTKVLRFIGPVIGYEKTRNGEGGTMTVTCAGVGWRLGYRLIGKSQAGATFGTTAQILVDRGEIMGRTIDALNQGENTNIFADANDTGIRRGTITASSTTYVSDWRYKQASTVMSDLSGPLDGPDWEIAPVEPTTDTIGLRIGALNVAPVIGQARPDVAFEFGTGKVNVADWKDIGDASTLANQAISLPPGFPDNTSGQVVTWDDSVSRAEHGLYEAVISSDVQTTDLRTKLVQNNVRVRKTPRRTIAFSPVAEDSSLPASERRVPRLFADYIVGDTIRFRAVERFPVFDTAGTVLGFSEVPTVDALVRVFAVQVDLDDNGTASTSLTVQNDL